MSKTIDRSPLTGGTMPDIGSILTDTIDEFVDDIGPYALAGLSYTCITVPLLICAVIAMYILMFMTLMGGMIATAVAAVATAEVAGDELGAVVGLAGYVMSLVMYMVVIFAAVAFIGCILAPLQASLYRRIAMHQRGERTLDITAPFSDMFLDLPRVLTVGFLVSGVMMVGFLLCYLPGFVALFCLVYAAPLVYLHKMGPVGAMRTSFETVKGNPGGHVVLTLVAGVVSLFASYVPVLGSMFAMALMVRIHRTLFGDDEFPVLEITQATGDAA